MIIIAGAEHPRTVKYISISPKHCFHCHNDSYWIFEKTTYFISLFFVPVAPYRREYLNYCGICGKTLKLTREDFERMVKNEARAYK